MTSPRGSRLKLTALVIAAAVAVAAGVTTYAAGAWPRLEAQTLDARFGVRGPVDVPSDVVVVGIDDKTFDAAPAGLGHAWPLPRRLDAAVIGRLRADGARVIAFDVQFTEPTDPADDNALFDAVARAGNVVLATTEVDAAGQTDVLGGSANLRAAHAVAAAANTPADADRVIRRYPYRIIGLPSFATAVARAAGHPLPTAAFPPGGALIDFAGPPHTVPMVSFADVYHGRVDPRMFAGKVVVVGAVSPTLQDLHLTSTTSSSPMTGAELQAAAISTALHGNPLRPAPWWLGLLATVLAALLAPLCALRLRVLAALAVSAAVAGAYLVISQLAFDGGTVLTVTYPVAACLVGMAGMVLARYAGAFAERNAFSRRLSASERELVLRLAQAVESRDIETGEHIQRIGVLCRRLAREIGWSETDAETLMYASMAHDIGKIGIPDSILLKPGPLDADEWVTMKTHTTIGAQLLAGSPNPLLQEAEKVALHHHERWDGTGYPGRLAGEAIPLSARICAVVDTYDALLSNRVYKRAWALDEVLDELRRTRGTQLDPALVDAFLGLATEVHDELYTPPAESAAHEPRPHEPAAADEPRPDEPAAALISG